MFLEYFVPYYWTCYRRRPLCGKTGPTSFLSSFLTTKEHIISYSNSSGKMVKLIIFLKDIFGRSHVVASIYPEESTTLAFIIDEKCCITYLLVIRKIVNI